MARQGSLWLETQTFHRKDLAMLEDKYARKVDVVWNLLLGFNKGDTVAWADIEAAMGLHRDDRGGWTIVNRIRRLLLVDRQITAFVEPTIGLRLLTDTQTATEVPRLRQKKARRQINRGLRETDSVDHSQLTLHAAKSLAVARQHMRAERLAISRGAREVELLLKPSKSVLG
jgi:hypothetical protein